MSNSLRRRQSTALQHALAILGWRAVLCRRRELEKEDDEEEGDDKFAPICPSIHNSTTPILHHSIPLIPNHAKI